MYYSLSQNSREWNSNCVYMTYKLVRNSNQPSKFNERKRLEANDLKNYMQQRPVPPKDPATCCAAWVQGNSGPEWNCCIFPKVNTQTHARTTIKFKAHLPHLHSRGGWARRLRLTAPLSKLINIWLPVFFHHSKKDLLVFIRKMSLRERQLLVFYDYSFKVERNVWNRLCRVHLFADRYLSVLLPLLMRVCMNRCALYLQYACTPLQMSKSYLRAIISLWLL